MVLQQYLLTCEHDVNIILQVDCGPHCISAPRNIYDRMYIYKHSVFNKSSTKYTDGFSGVPRTSLALGGTVSGSTFRWHLSHLLLDLFSLLVQVEINFAAISTSSEKRSRRRRLRCHLNVDPETVLPRARLVRGTPEKPSAYFVEDLLNTLCTVSTDLTTARTYVGTYIYEG